MTGFSSPSLIVQTTDGQNMILVEPFTFTQGDGTVHSFPKGMTSNGASVPRALWETLAPFGSYWMAAFAHDYLYRSSSLDKDTCDALFDEMMVALGVKDGVRKVLYDGVHFCGWVAFERDRKDTATCKT